MINTLSMRLDGTFKRDDNLKGATIEITNFQEVYVEPKTIITSEDQEITNEFKECVILCRALFAICMGLVANRLLSKNREIVTTGLKDIIGKLKNISTETPK